MIRVVSFSFKTFIIRMFSLILFFGCTSFVIHRGYKCLQKYLEKPEAIDVAFKSSGSQTAFFPSISFCSWYNKPLKENILKGCNLTSKDYLEKNIWVGKGHSNCTDPRVLRDQTIYGLDDLKMEIDKFEIGTYENSQLNRNTYTIYPNDSRLQWTRIIIPNIHSDSFGPKTCHTMKLPEEIVELGISYFRFLFQSLPHLKIYWHQNGLYGTDMPGNAARILINGNGSFAIIEHETLELLEYDGEKCEKSKDYKLNKCRNELIEKVITYLISLSQRKKKCKNIVIKN